MEALFFISFVLLGTMIVLNLFIGVIVGSMSEAQTEDTAKGKLSGEMDALCTELDALRARLGKARIEVGELSARQTKQPEA